MNCKPVSLLSLEIFAVSLPEAYSLLGLDAVFFLIYVAVMMVYSGVLTAVTLGVIPLFIALTFIASPAIKAQLRKAAENAATQALVAGGIS